LVWWFAERLEQLTVGFPSGADPMKRTGRSDVGLLDPRPTIMPELR
jgi:hypothetical protein